MGATCSRGSIWTPSSRQASAMAVPAWKVKPQIEAPSSGVWLGPGSQAQTDGLWIGSLAELVSGKIPQVWLSTAKEQVISIVGKRGSGKSFTLGVVAEG